MTSNLIMQGKENFKLSPNEHYSVENAGEKMLNEKQLKSNLKGEKAKSKSKEFNITFKCSWNL